ncbi:hypothetical protein AB0M79_09565 [Polymorphospora sp. NPDC051019]|uniref:hypothetical protein n=1 Tax=Polymorphospora sp. NPDC051019 TaxID=3155725 RepID=UPI00344170C3
MPVAHPAQNQVEDVPADVTDVLLWRMAAKVIAAHQPQPERSTRCTSLLCIGQHYPAYPYAPHAAPSRSPAAVHPQ